MKYQNSSDSYSNTAPKWYTLKSSLLIFLGIVCFCALLLLIGFPMWTVLVFGSGMTLTLLALYLIASVQMELNAKEKLLEDAIKQDLYP